MQNQIGIFQQQVGFIFVDKCLKFFVESANKTGASMHYQEIFLNWKVNSNKIVEIKTNRQHYQGRSLIVALGSWSTQLFPELNFPLIIVQKSLLWANASASACAINKKNPCFAYHLGFPALNGKIKVARHTGGLKHLHPEGLYWYKRFGGN